MADFDWALTPLPGTVTGVLGDDGTNQGAVTPQQLYTDSPPPSISKAGGSVTVGSGGNVTVTMPSGGVFTVISESPGAPFGGIYVKSGATNKYTSLALGRTTNADFILGIAGVSGNFSAAASPGDTTFLHLGTLYFTSTLDGVFTHAVFDAAGNHTFGKAGSVNGNIRLVGFSSGFVTVTVPNDSGTWTFSLPTSAGSAGGLLTTDGTGVSSWGTKASLKISGPLFDHFADGATTHTDGTEDTLYTDTVAAGQLATNGDMVRASYSVAYAGHALSTDQTQAYFGGTKVLDSGAINFATAGNASVRVEVIRETSTVVRVKAEFIPSGISLQPIVTYTRVTGLTLSGTNILKITGIAASTNAAAGDITAKLGKVEFIPAA